jgi:hypothetical protein
MCKRAHWSVAAHEKHSSSCRFEKQRITFFNVATQMLTIQLLTATQRLGRTNVRTRA